MGKNKLFDKLKIYEVANQDQSKGGRLTSTLTTDECTTKGTTDSGDCGDQGTVIYVDSVDTTKSCDQGC